MRQNDYVNKGIFDIFDKFVPVFRAIAAIALFFVLLKTELMEVYPISAGNAFIYGYFVYSAILLIFNKWRGELAFRFPLAIPLVDTLLMTACIAYTGGESSPILFGYAFVLVFMALTYGIKHTLTMAAVCTLSYIAAVILVNGGFTAVGGINVFLLIAFSLFTALLEDKLHKHKFTMAHRDSRTSLYNYEYFQESLEHLIKESARDKKSLSLAVMDVDDFKKFNDRHGHLEGDRILSVISSVIKPLVRAEDIPARYGGDELVIVFPNTGKFAALKICERIKENIVKALNEAFEEKVTISIGISAYPDNGQTPTELFDAADKALYKAKEAGKDNIVLG